MLVLTVCPFGLKQIVATNQKWLIFQTIWALVSLLIVLELISQSSNFSRITILRNGVSVTFI